jgi:hypothetical protein
MQAGRVRWRYANNSRTARAGRSYSFRHIPADATRGLRQRRRRAIQCQPGFERGFSLIEFACQQQARGGGGRRGRQRSRIRRSGRQHGGRVSLWRRGNWQHGGRVGGGRWSERERAWRVSGGGRETVRQCRGGADDDHAQR